MAYGKLIVVFALVGCGGDFTTATATAGVAGSEDSGTVGSPGGASTTTGGASTGGTHATGGNVPTGGALGSGGALSSGGTSTGGAASGGNDGGASIACLTDLSDVGAGDFSIHFTLTTTESVLTLGLLNQRTGCDVASTFWDVSLSPTGGVVAVTCDGVAAHYVFVEAGNSLNDGKPHKVDVIRRDGKLWYASDGTIHSSQPPDPYAFGTFPPLVLGSSACTGTTPAAGHATISDVCLTKP